MTQHQTSRVSDRTITREDFRNLTGGSIDTAYDLLVGYYGAMQKSIRNHYIFKTCPKCGGRMNFRPLDSAKNPNGYTGVWSCYDMFEEEGVVQCTYEEFTKESHQDILGVYGIEIPKTAPLVPEEALDGKKTDDNDVTGNYIHELSLAAIYEKIPRESQFSHILPDWVRRRCPKCGNGLLFYQAKDNTAGKTGIFACPTGWAESEDPDDWCGYEEVVDTPVDELFAEYYHRAVTRQEAATSLLLRSCPLCGNRLMPRPIESNDRGWKTRWVCPSGFQHDDPDALCGYEELSTESIGSYLKSLNKMIAEG